METDKLSNFIKQIESLTTKPEKYLSVDQNQINLVKVLTKNLYDFTKQKENPKAKALDVLEKLSIINLDEEQIWQQIDLQNNSVFNNFVHEISQLSAKKSSLKFPLKENEKKIKSNVSEQKTECKIVQDKIKKRNKCHKKKTSIVDDKFFKLHEMEEFLEAIEKEEGKENEYASLEYFENDSLFSSDDEKQYVYNDFFDQPEEESSDKISEMNFDEGSIECSKKSSKFFSNEKENINSMKNSDENENNLEEGYDDVNDEEDDEDDDEDDDGNDDNNNEGDDYKDIEVVDMNKAKTFRKPSGFELRQERLKLRIKSLEDEVLKEKPWQLKGEVTASSRPQNSLLEEYIEFDIATRPAPILTEKSTLKLEDVIIQRIKDLAWDDVARKIKPVENDTEYKKKLVLDQEKSKLSLAQIYEKEYLKQLESKSEEIIEKSEKEGPEHQEIRILMDTLFSKLDALSNFHFTPNRVTPEVKILSNLPAINMEEVAPVATSDAALLAPEEVKPKFKGDLIGKSERTKTDRNREKRQKKLKQKLKYKKMEAKLKSKLEHSGLKDSPKKEISQKLLQKITKNSNVIQLNRSECGKYVKSSSAFFSKLQNETKSLIKKKNLDIKKLKLNEKANLKKSTV